MACWAWKVPSLPVKPCTSNRVFSLTRTLIGCSPCGRCHHFLRRVAHPVGNDNLESRFAQDFASLLGIGALHADHDRNRLGHRAGCLHHALRHDIAAQDSAEDIDEYRLHGFIGKQDAERIANLFDIGAAAASRKFAGLPPANFTISMVAMANPAPFTRQATLPSSLMYVNPNFEASTSRGSSSFRSR